MCVGVRNVLHEIIWTTATVLCAQVRTGFFDAYCTYVVCIVTCIAIVLFISTCAVADKFVKNLRRQTALMNLAQVLCVHISYMYVHVRTHVCILIVCLISAHYVFTIFMHGSLRLEIQWRIQGAGCSGCSRTPHPPPPSGS